MTITIDCNRRIRKLSIEFDDFDDDKESDRYIPKESKTQKVERVEKSQKRESLLDTSENFDSKYASQEVIEKPKIEEKERPVLVCDEMQNMAF